MFYCLMGGNTNMWFGVFVVFGNVHGVKHILIKRPLTKWVQWVEGCRERVKKSVECSELGG